MSISIELAKQLRDAKFRHDWNMYDKLCKNGYTFLGLPTLEELIEQCGSKNLQLTSDANGTWTAYSFITATSGTGLSPAEATARLWLAHDHTKV